MIATLPFYGVLLALTTSGAVPINRSNIFPLHLSISWVSPSIILVKNHITSYNPSLYFREGQTQTAFITNKLEVTFDNMLAGQQSKRSSLPFLFIKTQSIAIQYKVLAKPISGNFAIAHKLLQYLPCQLSMCYY